ncbi:hypothetical protein [Leptolyngbya sp. BL0902]|uniref:hypothetical protein n=1 Tax=Leptolyngbya sp. BL0902 TaxID=1115757 RepID=UPI0018E8FC8F|nr:hypothetical protein [Leptolyngbya sp. BL0902]
MTHTSLSAYCKARNLPKASVHKFLKAQCFNTTEGMTSEMIAAADAYFLDDPQPSPTEDITGGLSVVVGNHCTAIEPPSYQGLTVDLGQFRDSESLVISDPLAVAEQFLSAADHLQSALAADIAAREARLQQTRQAQRQIEAKAQQLALEQRLYRLQTAQLDQAQTEETQALAAHLEALQALGKPAATSPQP